LSKKEKSSIEEKFYEKMIVILKTRSAILVVLEKRIDWWDSCGKPQVTLKHRNCRISSGPGDRISVAIPSELDFWLKNGELTYLSKKQPRKARKFMREILENLPSGD